MDIRTKLIFALVAVSLGSMFVLGAVVSPRVEGYLRDGTREALDQVAEGKSESLRWIAAGWERGASLVASRTQLRASLAEYGRSGDTTATARIRTILNDAVDASRAATLFEVRDVEGRVVVSVERRSPMSALAQGATFEPPPSGEALYAGVALMDSGPPQVTYLAPMTFEGTRIGTLVAVFEAPEIFELAEAYHGLGETGETLILTRTEPDGLRTLHPTRHNPGQQGGVSLPSQPGSLGSRALAGDPEILTGGVADYRGEEVWAATRAVSETGWGLVVKIDRAEVSQPVVEFTAWLRQTAVVLSAFAILLGLVLALRFALPIHALAEVANRIRTGEMDARAKVAHEDEVGLLARTFNEMADELQERMEQLTEFRTFFDVSIDLMCIAGTDGYFKRTNPAFQAVLGWSKEELLERPFFDLIHPEDVAKTEHEVAALADGIPTVSFENRFRCKDGSYKWLRWTSYPDRGVLYAIAHVVDGASTTRDLHEE